MGAKPNTKQFLATVTTKENTGKEIKPVSNPNRVGIKGKKSKPVAC